MEKGNSTLHFLDKYVGIPLVVFLGLGKLIRNKVPKGFSPQKIAILNISSIGDNVLMSAPIQDLKERFPDSHITVYCGNTNYGVVKMIPGVDDALLMPVTEVLKTIQLVRSQGKFDLMIDFGPWPRLNAVLSFFFHAKIKIGFRSIGQWRHFVYDYAILHSDRKHELDNFRTLLSPLQIVPVSAPRLLLPPNELSIVKPYIVFHPWPGGYKSYMKEWPIDNWVSLAEKMSEVGYPIYITGAKPDISASESLQAKSKGLLKSVAGKYNLAETSLLVENAALLVSVNTGIMHLGAAFGVPMVALHGPTSVKRWGPISPKALNVFPKEGGCGYLHFGYEYNKSTVNCMELITVDTVYKAVLEQLKTYAH
jgi:heptosyltransferase I